MTVFFAPIARLLGDLIVCLQPLQQLIAAGEQVFLVARSQSQLGFAECIPGLAGCITEPEFLARFGTANGFQSTSNSSSNAVAAFQHLLREQDSESPLFSKSSVATVLRSESEGKVFNLRDHPLQTDLVWGSPEYETRYPGYRIADVVAEISGAFGINYNLQLRRPLSTLRKSELNNTTVLIPGTASPIKMWSTQSWLELHRSIIARGENTVLIGEPDRSEQVRELIEAGISWIPTPKITDAVNVVSSAAKVVSVDTGLMHIAVHQGTPTIALYRSDAFFARTFPNVQNLFAQPCNRECREQEFNHQPNSSVYYSSWSDEQSNAYWNSLRCLSNSAQNCMSTICVDQVLHAMTKIKVPSIV